MEEDNEASERTPGASPKAAARFIIAVAAGVIAAAFIGAAVSSVWTVGAFVAAVVVSYAMSSSVLD